MVRARLPRKLRPQFDSVDFVQAVWKSFFSDLRRAAARVRQRRASPRVPGRGGAEQGAGAASPADPHREIRRDARGAACTSAGAIARSCARWSRRTRRPARTVQAADRLEQLIAGCSPREIEVLTLRRQGLTHVEIAERTGMNERSVRRIIESFRSRMEGRAMNRTRAAGDRAAVAPAGARPSATSATRGARDRGRQARARGGPIGRAAGSSCRRPAVAGDDRPAAVRPPGSNRAGIGAAAGRSTNSPRPGSAARRRPSRTTCTAWTRPTPRGPSS